MKPRIALGIAACAALILAPALPSAASPEDEEGSFGSHSESFNDKFQVTLSHLSLRFEDGTTTTSQASMSDAAEAYEQADIICQIRQGANEEGDLLNDETDLCEAEDGITAADIAGAVTTAFRTLPLEAPAITYQPDGTWALVNMDFIVYTGADTQSLDTAIFGVPITIRATPIHYTWDFGDGTTLATTDPGRPYPDQTVAHVYTSATDAVAVSLTTTWQGEFMIGDSGTWLPIAGTAATTSSTPPVEIVAMDVNLVPNS